MKLKDDVVKNKIIKYCDDIESLLKEYDYSFEKYKSIIAFQYACNMCIIQIGELVTRLSNEFKQRYEDIPWKAIIGMRNIHAHDYDNVDLEVVWNTLNDRIPELKSRLSDINSVRKEDNDH